MTLWEFACTFGAGLVCGAFTLMVWIGIWATMKAAKTADEITARALEQRLMNVTSEFERINGKK